VREFCTLGSVRGARSNARPYRDHLNPSGHLFGILMKELQVEIDVLHRQGKGIREIAREMGVSRTTVRAVLRGEHGGGNGLRQPRPTKLDP